MLRTSPRRLALVAPLLAVALLTACGSSPGGSVTVGNEASPGVVKAQEPLPAGPSVGPAPTADAAGQIAFAGVTVAHATDLRAEPAITCSSAAAAPGLLVQDLVVGTGKAAGPKAKAVLHYVGVRYADGTPFDANYDKATPEPEDLATAISGFAQGVGGTTGVTPMRVGGRRLLVIPASLGYGAVPLAGIPAHSTLVFVVDLLDVR